MKRTLLNLAGISAAATSTQNFCSAFSPSSSITTSTQNYQIFQLQNDATDTIIEPPLNPLLSQIKPSKTVEVFSLVKQMEAGKSALVLFCCVLWCVQYEDSAIRILHLNFAFDCLDCLCKPHVLTFVAITSLSSSITRASSREVLLPHCLLYLLHAERIFQR